MAQAQGDLSLRKLFVGGLYTGVTEEELKSRFQPFGNIKHVNIKKKPNENGLPDKTFAYVSFETTDKKLQQCMKIYNKCKWKGSELQLQLAKENFLDRLKKEQEAKDASPQGKVEVTEDRTEEAQEVQDFTQSGKGAKPGTLVEGKTDWVIGKYGRVLPIVHVRRRDKKKVMTVDPSKYCHFVKNLSGKPRKNEEESDTESGPESMQKLTWHIEEKDDEITKRIRGDFPEYKSPERKRRRPKPLEPARETSPMSDGESFEVVSLSSTAVHRNKVETAKSRFDSDSGEDTDDVISCVKGSGLKERIKMKVSSEPVAAKTSLPKQIVTKPQSAQKQRATKGKTKTKKKSLSSDEGYGTCSSHKCEKSPVDSAKTSRKPEVNAFESLASFKMASGAECHSDESADTDEIIAVSHKNTPASPFSTTVSIGQPLAPLGKCNSGVAIGTASSCQQAQSSARKDSDDDDDDDIFDVIAKGNVEKLLAASMPKDSCYSVAERSVQQLVSGAKMDPGAVIDGSAIGREQASKTNAPNDSLPAASSLVGKTPCERNRTAAVSEQTKKTQKLQKESRKNTEGNSTALKHEAEVERDKQSITRLSLEACCTEPEERQENSVLVEKAPSQAQDVSKQKEKNPKHVSKQEKHESDNRKRLQSMKERKQEVQARKDTLQRALAAVDKPTNKKIVFDSDSEEDTSRCQASSSASQIQHRMQASRPTSESKLDDVTISKMQRPVQKPRVALSKESSSGSESEDAGEPDDNQSPSQQTKKSSSKKLQLFDSDTESDSDGSKASDENSNRFRLRPEFEGKAGKKLLQLQSRFRNDQRFRLDERFLDDDLEDGSASGDDLEMEVDPDGAQEQSSKSEKERNLQILEQVVGPKAMKRMKRPQTLFRDMNALRYDPTKEGHEQFELKDSDSDTEPKASKKKKKMKQQKADTESEDPALVLPEVSSDRFYKVQNNLKEAFGQEATAFSLSTLFEGPVGEKSRESNAAEILDLPTVQATGKLSWQQPFSYDSSGSDSEDNGAALHNEEADGETMKSETEQVCRETFFFTADDPRLKEGLLFCRAEDMDTIRENWEAKRDDLIQAYRLQRKRKLRKTKPSRPQMLKRQKFQLKK